MTTLMVIVLVAACGFYGYCLLRFGREIGRLRSQRLAVAVLRSQSRKADTRHHHAPSQVTVMSIRSVKRDVA